VDESIVTYEEGHIPGAIGLEWKRDLQDPVRRDVLGPDDFGDLMGSRGISNRHAVVLYGDRDNWFAAYAYWCLVYYGHRRVKLLNGARAKWVAEGRPLSTEAARYPEADFAARAPDEAIRARRDGVRDALDTATRIVDVRNPGEFTGEMVAVPGYEHEAPQRSGHIPGATSVPWASALREDGTFKPVDELRDLYAAAATEDERVIVYCLLGGRSAHTWFALHELLGVDSAANYDGGWSEWGAMIDVPIETGP
jgi:thiosulfate/3-mercaptopyruvate sulfurtransferase